MDRIRFILLTSIIMAFLFCACNPSKNNDSNYNTGYNFEECCLKANEYMKLTYGDSGFYFYEAQATMSLLTDDSNFCDSAIVCEVKVIFQLISDSTVIIFTYPYNEYKHDSVHIDSFNGIWVEDLPLNSDSLNMSLSSALERYKQLDGLKPKGTKILIRHPDFYGFEKPVYFFFGCDTSFVCLEG